MDKTYEQIQREIAKLQTEAEKLRKKEIQGVIARIRTAIDHYGITAADLGLSGGVAGRKRSIGKRGRRSARGTGKASVFARDADASTKPDAAPRSILYRDEAGRTWVGLGKRPQWLRDALASGRSLDEFRVTESKS